MFTATRCQILHTSILKSALVGVHPSALQVLQQEAIHYTSYELL